MHICHILQLYSKVQKYKVFFKFTSEYCEGQICCRQYASNITYKLVVELRWLEDGLLTSLYRIQISILWTVSVVDRLVNLRFPPRHSPSSLVYFHPIKSPYIAYFIFLEPWATTRNKSNVANVAVPPAPVRVPSQSHLSRVSNQLRLSANDKGDNKMIAKTLRGSGICLTPEENPEKFQLWDSLV